MHAFRVKLYYFLIHFHKAVLRCHCMMNTCHFNYVSLHSSAIDSCAHRKDLISVNCSSFCTYKILIVLCAFVWI